MTGPDLQSYVNRSRALLESSSPSTVRETRTWLVDPFLATLGWDVHAETCRTNERVDETLLEYVFSVGSVPALFVAVEPYNAGLDESRAVELLEVMAWSGIDRAIYTDGSAFLFLAGTTDADRLGCRLLSLPEYESSIAHYGRTSLERHVADDTRAFVARRLALERSRIVESIVDELTTHAGDGGTYSSEFEAASERFLDQLVVSFAASEPTFAPTSEDVALEFTDATAADSHIGGAKIDPTDSRSSASGDDATPPAPDGQRHPLGDGSSSPATDETDDIDDTDDTDGPDESTAPSADASDSTPSEAMADDERSTADGEFVVRFFNDRGSIGAIGGSSSTAALVHATEYLLARGLSGVDLPWEPGDEPTVLNDQPVRADGSSMREPRELANGWYLEADGDVDDHANRVEAVTERAGLRAMLTGDWK
ncbi:hypothetical protein [Natrarchaeobaculum sulfurireducens]|uniref:ABC-type Na+ efflux pump, permease component n=1 Tax=Natrarchaeobaculum sulfurireducens TaxID=2044521 RepID=A0A346PPD2_9EURY|nr:hypothetical protein [Natrarchaeobaculum sulfurireducens]AXR78572.1 ABC-type Na+ efflux pump, permease component [Natrarchaeobaculum sulfurireducens]AXR81377.1 hypothetical protein AArcMg_1362 [Natrarchaeobaculum sulfurireducens]